MKRIPALLIAAIVCAATVAMTLYPIGTSASGKQKDISPYSIAYMKTLSDSNLKSCEADADSEAVLNSLDCYYDWDCALAKLLQETESFEYDYSMICSTEQSDKIQVMHALMNIFETVKSAKLKESILDYFRRYAPYTEDAELIAFWDNNYSIYKNSSSSQA